MIVKGTRVRYHGTHESAHGEFTVVQVKQELVPGLSDDGYRYMLVPVTPGLVSRSDGLDYLWNVRRQSFTEVEDATI